MYSETNYDHFADIYDYEYIDYHTNSNDINFYKSFLPMNGLVLELCCGTGRISYQIAEAGANVIGLDNSKKMLSLAKKKEKEYIRKTKILPRFRFGDMRTFNYSEKFSLAYIGFRSFMLLLNKKDQEVALSNIYKHLSPKGLLIISMYVPSLKRLLNYRNSINDEYCHLRDFNHPNSNFLISEYEKKFIDDFNQIAIYNLLHITRDKNGNEIEQHKRRITLRWTYRYEFEHNG